MNIFNIERSYTRRLRLNYVKSYWAIDLHDTIFHGDYKVGSAGGTYYPFAKEVLQYLTGLPDIVLILFTASIPSAVENALSRFEVDGIEFKYVNENPEVSSDMCSFASKFYFDVLLDDKGGFEGETDWFLIQQEIKRVRKIYLNPTPAVDAIILDEGKTKILLIERKNEPKGWALPGGFHDYGETCESAIIREVEEEVSAKTKSLHLFGVYSDPKRDPRGHTVSSVFEIELKDYSKIKAADDALRFNFFKLDQLPENLVFDHQKIIADYVKNKLL